MKDIRKHLKIPEATFLCVNVGNFKLQKNPLDSIRVASMVVPEMPNAHFVLVGDGPLRPECEALAKEFGIQNNIHFMGNQTSENVRRIEEDANCFFMVSLYEGLARALLEAMVAALPCVVYGVDGALDVIAPGLTGLLVDPQLRVRTLWYELFWSRKRKNIDEQERIHKRTCDMASKIIWVLRNQGRSAIMGHNARERITATREFDIDYMVEQQEELYELLAKQSGGGKL